MNLILKIVNIVSPKVPGNLVKYEGIVRQVSPIDLKSGSTVVTPKGLGEVLMIIKDEVSDKPIKVSVYLYRGYDQLFKPTELQQYVVYHKPSSQFLLITPQHYRYIYTDKQKIEYRVTTRKYAFLTESTRENYAYIKTLNKHRHGSALLNILRKEHIEIKKTK